MVCFLGNDTTFLPSPIVTRNTCGSNSRLLLVAMVDAVRDRSLVTGYTHSLLCQNGDRHVCSLLLTIAENHIMPPKMTPPPAKYIRNVQYRTSFRPGNVALCRGEN